ncbi:unnamed protein product [Toxocara canis]|uniref:CRIB domain-containing protein n=1 Tax=Toxocara canis TaxID=6265 RepID=A0A183V3U7_TOXCA|nr:unnamed protein product [Toxocara canis]
MKKVVPAPRPSLKHRKTGSIIQRDDISEPLDFRHIGHVGFDYVDGVVPEVDLQGQLSAAVSDESSTHIRIPVGYGKGATQEIDFDVHSDDRDPHPLQKTHLTRKASRKAAKDPDYVSHPACFQHLAHIEDTRSNENNFVVPKAVSDRTIRNMFYVVDRNIAANSTQTSSSNRTAISPRSSPNMDANRKAMIPRQQVKPITQYGFHRPSNALPVKISNNVGIKDNTNENSKSHMKPTDELQERGESVGDARENLRENIIDRENPYCLAKSKSNVKNGTENTERMEKQANIRIEMNMNEEQSVRLKEENVLPEDRVPLPVRRKIDASLSIDSQDVPTPITPFTPVFHPLPEEASQKLAYEKIVEAQGRPFVPVAPPRQRLVSSSEQTVMEKNATVDKPDRSEYSRTLPAPRKKPLVQQQTRRPTATVDNTTLNSSKGARMNEMGITEISTISANESKLKDELARSKPLEKLQQEQSSDIDRRSALLRPAVSSTTELKIAIQELDNMLDEHPSSSTTSSRQTSLIDTSLKEPHSGSELSEGKPLGRLESNEKLSVKELTKMLSVSNAKIFGVYGRDFKKTKPAGEVVADDEREVSDEQKPIDEEQPPPPTIAKVQHIGVNMFGPYDERTIAEIIAQKKMRKAPPPPVPTTRKPAMRKVESNNKTPNRPEYATAQRNDPPQSDGANLNGAGAREQVEKVPPASNKVSPYENVSAIIEQETAARNIAPRTAPRSSSVKVRASRFEMLRDNDDDGELRCRTLGPQNRRPRLSRINSSFSKSCEMLDVDDQSSSASHHPSHMPPAKLDHADKFYNKLQTDTNIVRTERTAHTDDNKYSVDAQGATTSSVSKGNTDRPQKVEDADENKMKVVETAVAQDAPKAERSTDDDDNRITARHPEEKANNNAAGLRDAKDIGNNSNNFTGNTQTTSDRSKRPDDSEQLKGNDIQDANKTVKKVMQKYRDRPKTCEVVTVPRQETISGKTNDNQQSPLRWRAVLEEKKEKKAEIIVATVNDQDKSNSTASKGGADDGPQKSENINEDKTTTVETATVTAASEIGSGKPVMNGNNDRTKVKLNEKKPSVSEAFSSPAPSIPNQSTDKKEENKRRQSTIEPIKHRHSIVMNPNVERPKLPRKERRFSQSIEPNDEKRNIRFETFKSIDESSLRSTTNECSSFKTTNETAKDIKQRHTQIEDTKQTLTTSDAEMMTILVDKSKMHDEISQPCEGSVKSSENKNTTDTTISPSSSSSSNTVETRSNHMRRSSMEGVKPKPRDRLLLQQTINKLHCQVGHIR